MSTDRTSPQLRPATRDDEPFLRALFAQLRTPDFAPLGLSPDALAALLKMQYAAQDRSYRQHHPAGDFDVVMVDGQPGGRLFVDRTSNPIHLIDIALLAEHRGRGLGTALLRRLVDEAGQSGRDILLHAVRGSRALSLYRRLGFELTGEDEVYLALTWSAARHRTTVS